MGQVTYSRSEINTRIADAIGGIPSITGSDTHVMFFDGADAPAGDSGLTFNKTTNALSVGGSVSSDVFYVASAVAAGRTGAGLSYPESNIVQLYSGAGFGASVRILCGSEQASLTVGPGSSDFVGPVTVSAGYISAPRFEAQIQSGGAPGITLRLPEVPDWHVFEINNHDGSGEGDVFKITQNGSIVTIGDVTAASLNLGDQKLQESGTRLLLTDASDLRGDHEVHGIYFGRTLTATAADVAIERFATKTLKFHDGANGAAQFQVIGSIAAATAADGTGLAVNLASAQTADAIQVTSNGGTAGDRFKVTAAGAVTAASLNLSDGSKALIVSPDGPLRLQHPTSSQIEVVRSDAATSPIVVLSGQSGSAAGVYVGYATSIGVQPGAPSPSNAGCTAALTGNMVYVNGTGGIAWYAGSLTTGTIDAGIARHSAGVVRISDGSTGYGSLTAARAIVGTLTDDTTTGLQVASGTADKIQRWVSDAGEMAAITRYGTFGCSGHAIFGSEAGHQAAAYGFATRDEKWNVVHNADMEFAGGKGIVFDGGAYTWSTSTTPVRIYRSAANTLTLDDNAGGAAALTVTGSLTAASLTATAGLSMPANAWISAGSTSVLYFRTSDGINFYRSVGSGGHVWRDNNDAQTMSLTNAGALTAASLVATTRVTSGVVTVATTTSTYTIDATQGNQWRITPDQNITLVNPTGGVNGQRIEIIIIMDVTGGYTLALDTDFVLPDGVVVADLYSTTAGKRSSFGATYDSATTKWYIYNTGLVWS